MTLRGRSIAIVSDGSILESEGKKFMPVMDWLVAQIKYYSGLDAFPFVIMKHSDINEILNDLSTCYGTVLLLENREIKEVPDNILVLKHQEIVQAAKTELTDAEKTSSVISYLIDKKVKGQPTK